MKGVETNVGKAMLNKPAILWFIPHIYGKFRDMCIQYITINSVYIYIHICTCIFHVSPDVFRYTWTARHGLFNMCQARLRLQASTTGPTADWAHTFSTKDMFVSLSICIQMLRCIYNHAIWSKCISKVCVLFCFPKFGSSFVYIDVFVLCQWEVWNICICCMHVFA